MNDIQLYHSAIDAIGFIREQEAAKKKLGKAYKENILKLYALTILTLIDIHATVGKRDKKATQLQDDFKAAGMTMAKAKRLIEYSQGVRRKAKEWNTSRTPDEMMEEFQRFGFKGESDIKKYVTGEKPKGTGEKMLKILESDIRAMNNGGALSDKAWDVWHKKIQEMVDDQCEYLYQQWKTSTGTENLSSSNIDNGEPE